MEEEKQFDLNKPNKNKKNRKRRNRNNQSFKGKKKIIHDGKELLPSQSKPTPKSSLPPIDVKTIKEPHLKCAHCNKVIKNIANAIKGNDCYYHFDCVLNKIKEDYKVKDNQKVSYIGRGNFAIVDKDEEGKMKFVQTIQIETSQQFDEMKKYVEGVKE